MTDALREDIESRSSRTRVLTVRVGDDEARAVEDLAEKLGLNLSGVIRVALLAFSARLGLPGWTDEEKALELAEKVLAAVALNRGSGASDRVSLDRLVLELARRIGPGGGKP
ncbi:MAG: ribbon-helix-helix protein, CopG family [Planctomycetes bacterium]|nr:ribbon-helix-helix protein, CopG family [Planctomycetota bacterium]